MRRPLQLTLRSGRMLAVGLDVLLWWSVMLFKAESVSVEHVVAVSLQEWHAKLYVSPDRSSVCAVLLASITGAIR